MKKSQSSATAEPAPTESLAQSPATVSALDESEQLLERLMQSLARELLAREAKGKPVSTDLPLLDRLMRYASYKLRREALRLRQLKSNQKPARTEHPQPSATTAPTASPRPATLEELPSEIADPKIIKFPGSPTNAPRKDESPIQSALRQAASHQDEFQIDPKIIALPLMGETPMVTTKPYDLI